MSCFTTMKYNLMLRGKMEDDRRGDNAYEAERDRNVLENQKKHAELRLKRRANELDNIVHQKKNKTKRARQIPTYGPIRSSARLNAAAALVQPGTTSAEPGAANVPLDGTQAGEKEVRKLTTMKSIWGRKNKPKLKLEINDLGQPIGTDATRFANFIGTQVRSKGFPLAFNDWRKVDIAKKFALWTEAKLFWDIDQNVFDWYMKTTHIKWKEFKADLKKDYFDELLEYNEEEYHALIAACDDRVLPEQWKWLVDHWLTPEAKARSERGKANRARHKQTHTAGSKSFARVDEEMTEELGYRPPRHQLFIRTHTDTKTGLPHESSASIIEKIREEAGLHPELLDKTMQEGDLFAHVFGREKHGYVCTIGLGPTPSDLELPGIRKYKSTKLQMEIEGRRRADQKVENMQQQMDEMREQMAEMRQMFFSSHDSQNDTPQQNTSSQPRDSSLQNDQVEVESNGSMHDLPSKALNAQRKHQGKERNIPAQYCVRQLNNIRLQNDDEVQSNCNMHEQPKGKTPNVHPQRQGKDRNIMARHVVQPHFNTDLQNDEEGQHMMTKARKDVREIGNVNEAKSSANIRRELLLYSVTRPFNAIVAKGVVHTVDPQAMVGGVPLGDEYSGIVINSVFKIATELPRPYEHVSTLGFARGKCIAWPTARLKDCQNK